MLTCEKGGEVDNAEEVTKRKEDVGGRKGKLPPYVPSQNRPRRGPFTFCWARRKKVIWFVDPQKKREKAG